jgi:hypothetical protein
VDIAGKKEDAVLVQREAYAGAMAFGVLGFWNVDGVALELAGELANFGWVENETLVLRPNPSMSESQRRALEMDYGMENGVLELVVKRAMRLYTLRRPGFIHEPKRLPLLNELKQLQLVALDSGN